jgi:Uncharacterized alpha/beta hydrolase domain (DUF2235)
MRIVRVRCCILFMQFFVVPALISNLSLYLYSLLAALSPSVYKVFKPTPMVANETVGPKQLTQLYFAGGHGGVGGGDTIEYPLSNFTLQFMVREMERRGLGLSIIKSRLPQGTVDLPPTEKKQSMLFNVISQITGDCVRGIDSHIQVHPSVAERYRKHPTWRPRALEKICDMLESPDEEWLASAL